MPVIVKRRDGHYEVAVEDHALDGSIRVHTFYDYDAAIYYYFWADDRKGPRWYHKVLRWLCVTKFVFSGRDCTMRNRGRYRGGNRDRWHDV